MYFGIFCITMFYGIQLTVASSPAELSNNMVKSDPSGCMTNNPNPLVLAIYFPSGEKLAYNPVV